MMLRSAVPAVLAATLLPAAVAEAAAPGVSTGQAARVTQTSVTLVGTVNARSLPTTFAFEYGTRRSFGFQTVETTAGSRSANATVFADVGALGADQQIFYRLVARNRDGVRRGATRAFRTRRQPLALALDATPKPVPFGAPFTLLGTLSGTGNAGQVIEVQANPFPYTQGFRRFGNRLITDARGGFVIAAPTLPISTQFRAIAVQRNLRTAVLGLGAGVRVSTDVTATRVRRGRSIRFSGSVRPAKAGVRFAIQKRTSAGDFVTVAGATTRARSEDRAVYGRTVRVPRGGVYRVFVESSGDFVSAAGREVRITATR